MASYEVSSFRQPLRLAERDLHSDLALEPLAQS